MEWKAAWSYLPINYNSTIGTIENITQRTRFTNNLNGSKIKIKFSNLCSKEPLILEKVIIGKTTDHEEIMDMKQITYQGSKQVAIGPGEEFYSDELEWKIGMEEDIVLSIYVKDKCEIQSSCSTWASRSWHTVYGMDGNYTEQQKFVETESVEVYPFLQIDTHRADVIIGIDEIQVFTDEKVKTVALFGDSITHMSYYSDALIEKLNITYPGKVTVINRGIGGNRLLYDATYIAEMPGQGSIFGKTGTHRFLQDVYGSTTPEVVIVLIGINDCVHPYAFRYHDEIVSSEQLIKGYMELIRIAHEKGSKIMMGTIMPYRNDSQEWFLEAEETRCQCNEWIRNQVLADGIVDFDEIIRDTVNPVYMQKDSHLGDGVHPNTAGGIKMAEAIPMEWFK
ncbi:MAG: GDSL-type esterase/lipase family protein [Mobilitalea sp.]